MRPTHQDGDLPGAEPVGDLIGAQRGHHAGGDGDDVRGGIEVRFLDRIVDQRDVPARRSQCRQIGHDRAEQLALADLERAAVVARTIGGGLDYQQFGHVCPFGRKSLATEYGTRVPRGCPLGRVRGGNRWKVWLS